MVLSWPPEKQTGIDVRRLAANPLSVKKSIVELFATMRLPPQLADWSEDIIYEHSHLHPSSSSGS